MFEEGMDNGVLEVVDVVPGFERTY
jgi:hypothetical protein